AATTGGVRWTMLWSAGISHLGRNGVLGNTLFSSQTFVRPHTTQHAIRIAQGNHAWMVSATPYLYFHSAASTVAPPPSRSDRSRNRSLGCHTKRRNSAVQITENTPDTTSVVR